MTNVKKILTGVIIAFSGGFFALYIYTKFIDTPEVVTIEKEQKTSPQFVSLAEGQLLPDLTFAAEKSVHAVVHIQSEYEQQSHYGENPLLDFLFGDRQRQYTPQPERKSGSGVIISSDGYIVTNNHVIENTHKIKVILNDNREFEAKLAGTDPNTDIALLKIEEKGLPFLNYGDSDNLKLGEWVLAVGNPFNLTSTVTAGIVSAKSRGIGIIQEQMSIESFIQTDAAVNPGNSGGALVDMQGRLVGINTAIASRTGSYAGYSFAVPVSIVKKVIEDIKQYGIVQRGLLDIEIGNITAKLAEEEGIEKIEGVYVAKVTNDGAAEEAGIEKGDIILGINNDEVNSVAQLQEEMSKYRPGDKVNLLIKRDNKRKLFAVTLRNTQGETGIETSHVEILGAKLRELPIEEKRKLNIRYGLKITELGRGQFKDAGIREGFIIVEVNKTPMRIKKDIVDVMKNARGGVLIEGIYPNGEPAYYVFGIGS